MSNVFQRRAAASLAAITILGLSTSAVFAENSTIDVTHPDTTHQSGRPEVKPSETTDPTEVADDSNTPEPSHPEASSSGHAATRQLHLEQVQDAVKTRLDNLKLQQCQKRQSQILSHLDKTTTTAVTIESKFASIAAKAEQFKTDKGITVSNYDALVANISTKQAQATADLNAAKTQAQAFDCSSDGPKAQLHQFVVNMNQVRQDLKDYRDAIKNLIQAIRQANGQNRQATSSASPSATEINP